MATDSLIASGAEITAKTRPVEGEVLVRDVLDRTPQELQRIFDSLPANWQQYIREGERSDVSPRVTGAMNSLKWLMEHPMNVNSEYLTQEGYRRLQEFALEEKFVYFYMLRGHIYADTEVRGNGDTVMFDRDWLALRAEQSEDTSVF